MNLEKERTEWQEKLDELAGMEEFKALMDEWITMFPVLKKTNNENLFLNRTYLFSIADGEGFSKQLELMAKACHFSEIATAYSDVKEVTMPYRESTEKSKKDATPASLAIEELREQGAFGNGSIWLAVDIREWIGRTGSLHFKRALEYLFDNASGPVVFRVPLMDERYLKEIEADLEDVRNVRTVVTKETTVAEYMQYAHILAKRRNMVIAKEAEEVLEKCLVEEKNQGYLKGYASVKKIFNEIVYLKILHMGKEHV